jgi:hypothetical protein
MIKGSIVLWCLSTVGGTRSTVFPETFETRSVAVPKLSLGDLADSVKERFFLPTYRYSSEQYREMRPRLASKVREQLVWDDRFGPKFFPSLAEMYEDIPAEDGGEARRIFLGNKISSSEMSVSFRVVDNASIVAVYEMDYMEGYLMEIHPLLREAIMLRELRDTNFVPKIEYLSPPAAMEYKEYPKVGFEISARDRDFAGNKAFVRFMLVENVETNLYTIVNNGSSLTLKKSLESLKSLMETLAVLHARGIVHGDIHAGNIGFVEDRLVIHNFGLSFFSEETLGRREYDRLPFTSVHCLDSPWTLDGSRPGFRDDVFQALMVAAYLMNGADWMRHCIHLEVLGEAMMDFKQNSFMFEYPKGKRLEERLEGKSVSVVRKIRFHLETVLAIGRKSDHVDHLPNHMGIIAHIEAVLALL